MKLKFSGRWQGYRLGDLRKDLISGITVGIIAIPLGMAFAIASGVKPEYGLYTTIIAGIIIALLGGSRFQVGGPTGAFIPILLAIVIQYGYENLLLAGLMSGIMLLAMGLFKLGGVIRYIPRPVTIGFTSGIAIIIFTGQIGNFLGLSELEQHTYFIHNIAEIVKNITFIDFKSIATAVLCLIILIVVTKYMPKVPASLVGIVVSTLFAIVLFGGDVPTIGSVFGEISSQFPPFIMPEITLERVIMLIGPAFTIALLGSIESLLSAVVADGMAGGKKHDSNRELIGQGAANIVVPFFGGIPATGAIARTAANIRSGAVSPFSAVFQGLFVLIVLLLLAPYASQIPLASLAPILMMVAWNMSERVHFWQLLRMRNSDAVVALITFLLTVFINLTYAVGAGLVMAALLFIKRMSELMVIEKVMPDPYSEELLTAEAAEQSHCPQISIYQVEGPLFFGAAQNFLNTMLEAIQRPPKIVILRLINMPFIDASGEASLSALITHFHNRETTVLISGLQSQPQKMLKTTGLYYRVGEGNFFDHIDETIEYALQLRQQKRCELCGKDDNTSCVLDERIQINDR